MEVLSLMMPLFLHPLIKIQKIIMSKIVSLGLCHIKYSSLRAFQLKEQRAVVALYTFDFKLLQKIEVYAIRCCMSMGLQNMCFNIRNTSVN